MSSLFIIGYAPRGSSAPRIWKGKGRYRYYTSYDAAEQKAVALRTRHARSWFWVIELEATNTEAAVRLATEAAEGNIASLQRKFAQRRDKIDTFNIGNEWPVPQKPAQFIAVEYDGDGDAIWAYLAKGLPELARAIENSDTEKVSCARAYDLDSGRAWFAITRVVEWRAEPQA
jgi:hypothetical protein